MNTQLGHLAICAGMEDTSLIRKLKKFLNWKAKYHTYLTDVTKSNPRASKAFLQSFLFIKRQEHSVA